MNFILNESLTDTVFHFTNMRNLYYIVRTNSIILSSSYENSGDSKLSYEYPYYLSLTRSFSNKIGYVAHKNSSNSYKGKAKPLEDSLNVRIEFDGRLLNSKYKGTPVNYHWKENLKNKQQKELSRLLGDKWEEEKELKLVTIRQDEDRLLSKEPKIEDISKYIKRIDITLSVNGFKGYDLNKIIVNLYHIINNKNFIDKIFIYTDENTFNRYHNDNFINDKIKLEFNKLQNFFNNTDNQNSMFKNRKNGISYKQQVNSSSPREITDSKILQISRILKYIYSIDNTVNINDLFKDISNELLKYNCKFKRREIYQILKNGFDTTNSENLGRAIDHLKDNFRFELRQIYTFITQLLTNTLLKYYKHNKQSVEQWLKGRPLTFTTMKSYFLK